MKRFFNTTRASLAGLALAGAMSHEAAAQFVTANNYQQPQLQQQQQPTYQAAQPNYQAAQPTYQAAPPTYSQPASPYYQQAQVAPPNYSYPRVAQAGDLPAPAEAVKAGAAQMAAEVTPAPQASYAAPTPQASYADPATSMPYNGGYDQSASHASYPSYQAPSYQAPSATASAGCATGNCGATSPAPMIAAPVANYGTSYAAPEDRGYGSAYGAPSCDLGLPARPRRQWFVGAYGLLLDRAGDNGKRAVAYMTDTAGFTAGNNYYYQPSDTILTTADAGTGATGGAEIRFGSTFGSDPCQCGETFAWEVGYWGIDDDSSSARVLLPGAVASTYTPRLYSLYNYYGVLADLDGPTGTDWSNRPVYTDPGNPADGDIYASDVRLIAVRVRQRFSAQNLELNFWRFGTPVCAQGGLGCGLASGLSSGRGCGGYDACGGGSCGTDSCGIGGGCAPAACAPSRPPRRFFINGLAGVRYLRVDDDFGVDQYFAQVDTTGGNQGNVPVGPPTWNNAYPGGFPLDDNQVMFSDFEATNELVGFQLGASMNWLVGCNWNFFADTNFGIYSNNAEVYKRIYGGGDATYTFANGGGNAAVRGSETNVAFVGELRAGVGYQLTCNTRLTAAYRLIGIGGVALGVEELQNTDWSNATAASHIDTNNSIILHGLQAGVEYKF